jgi:outer membrane receptor protein involved in Fe transport
VEPAVRGGNRDWQQDYRRAQVNGSLSYFSDSRYGRHHLKAGGEIQRLLETESWQRSYPGDVLHVLRSGAPAEIYLFQTPSRSRIGQSWYVAFLNDSWQVNGRWTLNLGLRYDRFRIFLPEQDHPVGRFNATPQSFAAIDNLIDWNAASPRIGTSYDLTGDGRTIVKSSYGLYRLPPGTDLLSNLNPNARSWWERYSWSDANQNLVWEPGEESQVPLERRGGTSLETLDPELKLAYVRELTTRLDRELNGNFKIGTGVIWRGVRQQGARQRASWSFDAFTVATTRRDPGPAGGMLGPPGDEPGILLYELPDALIRSSESVVSNVARSNSDYLTWEITADRRFNRRWSLAASFAHTWNHDQAGVYFGQTVRANALPLTPNDLIQTDASGRHVFRVWSTKLLATFEAPWQVRITPFLRHQSGQPFGRTLAASLNYGTIRVLAEPIGARRQDHITLLDVGLQKRIPVAGGRHVTGFLEIFNVLNSNAEQNVNWASGPSFLRPLTIVPPRIARIGLRVDW